MVHEELSRTLSENILICLRKIIQSIDLHSRDLVRRVGLTGPQLTILNAISKNPEGVSVGEIAAAISLSMGTVTGILERLEKRGLISRKKSSTDKRRVMLELSNEGSMVVETAPSLLQDAFVKELNNLQSWEQTMMLSSLQRLVSMMKAREIKAAPILVTGPIEPSIDQDVH